MIRDRGRPIGLPRTRSTFADGFFQPDHPPLRRDPFDKFQTSIPAYNRFRDGISDPSSRMFTDDDDLMFFDNFPRRPFYADPEFFHASMPHNEEPPFFQTPPREPMPPPPTSHHQRSKSHYDNVVPDHWDHPNRPSRVGSDEQMPFDDHHHPHLHQSKSRHQPPNDPNVHVIKIHHEGAQPGSGRQSLPNNGRKFVEINNSVPNYELLNSDKRRRRSNSRQEDNEDDKITGDRNVGGDGHHRRSLSIPRITIDDFSCTNTDNDQPAADTKTVPIPLPAPAIPLPAPEGMMTINVEHESKQNKDVDQQKTVTMDQSKKNVVVVVDGDTDERVELDEFREQQKDENSIQKQTQIDEIAEDDLLQLLDKTEHLTEQLRENAIKLEQEKETILDKINSIKASTSGRLTASKLSQAERDGLMLNLQRILARCNSVNISVETPRDPHQSKALDQVNKMIQSALGHTDGTVAESKQKINGFLNACHPDEVGNIDEKFQSAIIECTADDQKKIRRKLAQIVEQMNDSAREKNVKINQVKG